MITFIFKHKLSSGIHGERPVYVIIFQICKLPIWKKYFWAYSSLWPLYHSILLLAFLNAVFLLFVACSQLLPPNLISFFVVGETHVLFLWMTTVEKSVGILISNSLEQRAVGCAPLFSTSFTKTVIFMTP